MTLIYFYEVLNYYWTFFGHPAMWWWSKRIERGLNWLSWFSLITDNRVLFSTFLDAKTNWIKISFIRKISVLSHQNKSITQKDNSFFILILLMTGLRQSWDSKLNTKMFLGLILVLQNSSFITYCLLIFCRKTSYF